MAGKKKKRRLRSTIRRASRKTLLIILTVLVTVMIFGYFALLIILKGPSSTFSDYAATTLLESRRGRYLVRLFYTEEEIQQIEYKNNLEIEDAVTYNTDEEFVIPDDEKDDLTIVDVSGSTFQGKLMIVRDPSRISLGVNTLMPDYNSSGFSVLEYVENAGAVAGINAGGFDDPNGQGDGSIPMGVVIKDGEMVAGSVDDWGCIIGFNSTNHLIVGNMTGQQALDWGLVNAVTFGPVLIANGVAATVTGTGGGLNPRTVIGQTSDGTVLLLVIDGRQTTSLGATYDDCIQIMLEYGAINAANLDGGSSSVMVYNGEIVNNVVSLNGDRNVPTAWLVQ